MLDVCIKVFPKSSLFQWIEIENTYDEGDGVMVCFFQENKNNDTGRECLGNLTLDGKELINAIQYAMNNNVRTEVKDNGSCV